MKQDQDGFTLVELVIIVTLISFLSTLVFAFMLNFWAFGYKLEAGLDTLTTRLNVGDYIRESVGTSTGLITQNSIQDNHPMKVDTSNATGKYWLPIHAVPGNKAVGASGTYTPVLYYRRPSFSTTGNYIMNNVQPYEDEYVLYLDGTKKALMLRILANSAATNNRAATTCPSAFVTSSCPLDKTLATDVASVDLRYFSRTGLTIDWTSIYDSNINSYIGPDFPVVEVLEIKVNLSKKAKLQQGNSETNSTIIRIALRNA